MYGCFETYYCSMFLLYIMVTALTLDLAMAMALAMAVAKARPMATAMTVVFVELGGVLGAQGCLWGGIFLVKKKCRLVK